MIALHQRVISNLWCCLLFLLPIEPVLANDSATIGDSIVIGIAEARADTTTSDTSTVYMQIVNYSKTTPITLTHVHSEIASNARLLHSSKQPLTIAPEKTADIADEGHSIQLEGLKKVISKGDKIPLVLTFAHGDSYVINAIGMEEGSHYHEDATGGYIEHQNHE